MTTSINDRPPNFRKNGTLYLVRCFGCEPIRGRENWALATALSYCAWCGWMDTVTSAETPTGPDAPEHA